MTELDDTKERFRRLEIDADEPSARRPFRPAATLNESERTALRDYLDALENYERAETTTHPAPPVAWQHLREMLVDRGPTVHRQTGDDVLYRTVEPSWMPTSIVGGGMIVCRSHLLELRAFKFNGGSLRVRAVGARERFYAKQPDWYGEALECRMCRTKVAHGNVCYRDECVVPLHPQWPVVYCSNECAMEDR